MQNNQGVAIVVSAPSGAGKSTLTHKLINEFKNVFFSVSCTTRQKRVNEVDGVDYYFVSEDEFFKLRDNNELAEWAKVHDYYYATPIKAVQDKLAQGFDVILDIDVQGAIQIKKTMPKTNFLFIFPPNLTILEQRLIKRATDSLETIQKRVQTAKKEILMADFFDAYIVNDDLDKAYEQFKAFYLYSKMKNFNYSEFIKNI